MLPLLLASSSPYRRELLARLQLPFAWAAPDIDEQRIGEEPAPELVKRLARHKAEALAASHPGHLIIGSDQVAVLGEQILGKPHTFEKACEQLLAASGNHVTFLTGVALLNTQSGHCEVDCVPFTVHMRELDLPRIERYLHAEQPYDCAGSFKCEGLGVSLFQSTHGCDATSLVGLPLIRLVDMLLKEGVSIP
ncbi:MULTISPECIES: nucleoside triphosphate pyrophosphatase [Pseudomonas]|jgi:MAF protein|uniref:7-methyl-GTP pyrophosphatase n=1 Tax=Pseudomonas qingdaonensis TaxID=2056231 RepID=A0ABX8DQE6_9PSED|nr:MULTISPECIES: nucleoside triphosphate pyrophosphatase [Pseudomonas]KIU48493.1 septum formation inhibitor Maf [Pseudomonas putida]MBG8560920.1 septum formation inhibitor Maf [Pseudomonas qingdaonensis]MCO7507359.1 Maf-like protein [Pseudomonas sp. VE 267-6A]MCO7532897.1 Maf-like protein [Pseudomonas sp. 2]MCP8347318.1 septum formation inhibitor Maf [Pseudomonas sp. FBF18]